jgi:hypothetical protein
MRKTRERRRKNLRLLTIEVPLNAYDHFTSGSPLISVMLLAPWRETGLEVCVSMADSRHLSDRCRLAPYFRARSSANEQEGIR